jgi:hypothetical protein
MKTFWIIILAAATAALGGFSFYQCGLLKKSRQQVASLQSRLTAAEEQLAQRSSVEDEVAQAERKAKVLQETLTQASQLSATQSKQVSELQESLASKTNSNGFADLFKNPEMRDMIKAQQKAFMSPMIDKNYAALFQQLNLTPEQTAYVKELIEKKMLTAADMGMAMMDGSLNAEKRKELAKQVKADTDAIEQELKKFLGDHHKTFEDYERTIPDRMNAGQFKDQLAGTGTALDGGQEERLLEAMQEARSGFKWTTDYQNNNNPADANFSEMFTEKRLNQHFQEQTEYDRQLVQKAAAFLRPDQLGAYEKFLENQRNVQAAGMKIAATMFGTQNK